MSGCLDERPLSEFLAADAGERSGQFTFAIDRLYLLGSFRPLADRERCCQVRVRIEGSGSHVVVDQADRGENEQADRRKPRFVDAFVLQVRPILGELATSDKSKPARIPWLMRI